MYFIYQILRWGAAGLPLFFLYPYIIATIYVYMATLGLSTNEITTTACFGKVYRTIFQSKRRRLVFKTGVIMYIQNYTLKNYSKIFKNIFC